MNCKENEWIQWELKSKPYLLGKCLSFKHFNYSNTEHDHCELCWTRFGNHANEPTEGFFEPKSQSIICSECFQKFKNEFKWTLEK